MTDTRWNYFVSNFFRMQVRRYTINYPPLLFSVLVILVALALVTDRALALFYPVTYHPNRVAPFLGGGLVVLFLNILRMYHNSDDGRYTFQQLIVVILLALSVGALLGVVNYFV